MKEDLKYGLDRFIREPEVVRITGLSRATIWRKERDGEFPKRVKLSSNASGWLASEIRAWMDQLAANRDTDQAA